MLSIQERTCIRSIIFPGETASSHELGGKAGALAALYAAHMPIPSWFVVSPVAFRASLADAQQADFAAACSTADLPAIANILAAVQLNANIREELNRAVSMLCPAGEYVAVRSSASDEDGARRSFAGQLESFLFISPEQVAEKVVEVWRSGFSERVLAYRREHGLTIVTEPPAVLVQRMVDAEVAGVAFSADPVSGRRGNAVVSALYGLGTALVSGECDADTYIVDRDGTILSRTIAEKQSAHRHICGNIVECIPVPSSLVTQAALSDEQARAVAELARRCERHFSCPHDIEWALADGELFLLQARPITALARMADPDGQQALWDNSNIAESYNGVTTPLTFSFARYAYEQVYRQMLRVLGVHETVIQRYSDTLRHMIGLIQGRVYYNLLNWYRLLALMPGFTANRKFMEQMMGVKEGLPESIIAELDRSTWGERARDRLRLLKAFGTLLLSYCRLPRDIQHFFQRIDRALAPNAVALEQMRPDELVAAYRSLEQQLITHWDAPLINDLFAMLFYGLLRSLAVRWCDDKNGTLQNDLLSGEGGIISVEPATRTRAMASLAASHPQLIEKLCYGSQHEIQQAMGEFPDFVNAYHAYLEKFADRCLEELKLESATLRDDPLPLLRSIGHLAKRLQRGAADMRENEEPGAREETKASFVSPSGMSCRQATLPALRAGAMGLASLRQTQRRPQWRYEARLRLPSPSAPNTLGTTPGAAREEQTLRSRAEQRVSTILRAHPVRRLLFGWIVKQARMRVRDRENLRFERTRVFGRVRRIFSELGCRFYALDLLEEPRDIFYLEVEEVLGFVTGAATTTNLKGLVSVRKAEYARFKTLAAPADRFATSGIVNHGNSFTGEMRQESGDGEARQGIGCCPGVVRGPVRMIADPQTAEIHAGEILVAQRTDPGWIMLFPAAAGVLVERGSLLSHSAIVAREMGIPTIVALSGVTGWLRDGDWIEMDGSSGQVRKLVSGEVSA